MDPMIEGVFVVDDDLDCRTALGDVLEDMSFSPTLFHDPREALAALARTSPALILTEMGRPGMPAAAPFQAMLAAATRAELPVIVFSGWDRTAVQLPLPFPFIPKPDVAALLDLVRALVPRRRRGPRTAAGARPRAVVDAA